MKNINEKQNKKNRIINVTKNHIGEGFQILSANKPKKFETKSLNKKFEELKILVSIYTYIFAYTFLRIIEISKEKTLNENNLKTIEDELEKIYGRLHSEWPENIKNHFTDKLFFILPQENLFKFFRETIYYLIFVFSSYANKYLKPSEYELMLDELFEIFKSSQVPWLILPPEEDAFNKYNDAENPILKYNSEIREIESDSLLLFDFQNIVVDTFKFMITPMIDKIFEDKK